jgi:eukaryotic-like serine/threonine-protein kinase
MNDNGLQRVNLVSNKGERFCYYQCDNARLGGGAMGEVFKGWRAEDPGKKVAIKRVYSKHAENPEIRRRARYEATLSIDHPNLIKMLGYCEFDRIKGPMFIVSELVQGNTIDKFVGSIDIHNRTEIVSRMICSVLDALICLHNQEPPVWHRDIKPSNIMVENGCNVRIMDLGIATSEGISLGTVEGKGFGTYPYAPPEQITGQRNQIDATSDIYSLGVSFYELLTGVNPFTGGSDIDIIDKQISMELPYNDVIPKPLFKVILKATAKKQSNRYKSAEEFKTAIQNIFIRPAMPFPWKTVIIFFVSILILFIIIFLTASNN